ncbi:hypothetical protein ACFWPU_11160 [Streptomyces sp. NPDC058471]|uniref:hypothetical protein n=1 Tax=Streptomyces sp. NPDC058471 TaxID=3346516 RepID=UPI0036530386
MRDYFTDDLLLVLPSPHGNDVRLCAEVHAAHRTPLAAQFELQARLHHYDHEYPIGYFVLVIRLWIGEVPTGRAGRIALLFGLVLLITAHLSGGVHSATFAGPHAVVGAAACSGLEDETELPGIAGGEHRPGHDHHADSHFDHTVDRPRVGSGDTAAAPLDDPGTLQPAAGATAFSFACPGGPRNRAPCVPSGRAALVLNCTWRQ